MKYYFIVAAAGVGKRMGLGYPKQFLEYEGKPIFIKTLETIDNSDLVTDIIVVTNKDSLEKVKEYCKKYKIMKLKCVVEGGKERQDSVYRALKYVDDYDSITAVQDGVRPFIKDKYITETYNELTNGRNEDISGVVIGVSVKDTIKIVDERGIIKDTPARSSLVAAHTPQVFKTTDLIDAYKIAEQEKFLGTDDSSLLEKLGKKVKVIKGEYDNVKITTPEDLIHLR